MGRIFFVLLLVFSACRVEAAVFDHGVWDTLLKKHVVVLDGGRKTQVDYHGFLQDRKELRAYLDSLAEVDRKIFDQFTADEQLAFLINSYNGWTVELILTKYPDLESIKDLGSFFQSPWKKRFFSLLGKTRSLDEIEHKLIRGSGRYNDPRIHFAVNCASIGCPALRPEAYNGRDLQRQLQEASEFFLSDSTRNRYTNNRLEVSSIFKWYREDFEKGWKGISSLGQFFANHGQLLGLDEQAADRAMKNELEITYLKYNWKLNSIAER
ncbi:DUF547 domain-containing protein [Desulfomarina sp.]